MRVNTVVSTILGRGQIRQIHLGSDGQIKYLVRLLDVPKDFYELRVFGAHEIFETLLTITEESA
jgi:hypothetical protein